MYKFLDKKQRQDLLDELKIERSRRYADRIRVILLLDQKWTYKKIAEALFIDEGTIANYKKRYREGQNDIYRPYGATGQRVDTVYGETGVFKYPQQAQIDGDPEYQKKLIAMAQKNSANKIVK